MKNITLITLLLLCSANNIFSQNLKNNPLDKKDNFKTYQDTNTHTQMKLSENIFDTIVYKNKNIKLNPILLISTGIDISSKKISYNVLAGINCTAAYKNKLFVNSSILFGGFAPFRFQQRYIDSIKQYPGTLHLKKINQNNFYSYNFLLNLIYRPKKFIYFELGHDNSFFGDGYRSLLLSRNTMQYPYIRAVVDIWRIKYLYQIAQMQGIDYRFSSVNMTKKYVFTHFLSLNIVKRLNISFFETVVQASYDSLLMKRNLELSYLNPVIFLRPVEYNIGSPDNVLMGFSGHIKIFKSGMLYGQVFIDEFILTHILSEKEYWDEKYGIQGGMKFYNTGGIENLYSQIEFNAVRPYTYSHVNGISAYTNNHTPLAHPLGANFVEGIAILGYTKNKWNFQTKVVYSKYGENDTLNYGRNPDLSYATRANVDNVEWLQGTPTTLKYAELMITYSGKINYSATCAYRTATKEKNLLLMFSLGTKLIYNKKYDYN